MTKASKAVLADDSVGAAQVEAGAVDTAELADDAVTLAKLAGGTAGKFLGFDGAGDPAELTAPGGAWAVASVTDFGAGADSEAWFTDLDTAKDHLFVLRDLTFASNATLSMRVSADTGGTPSEDTAADYDMAGYYTHDAATAIVVIADNGQTSWGLFGSGTTMAAARKPYGEVLISGLAAGLYLRGRHWGGYNGAPGTPDKGYYTDAGIFREDTAAVNAVRFYTNGPNITDGEIVHLTREAS